MAEAPSGLRILLHQHVKERAPVPISSHADRDRVLEVFRNALSQKGPPSSFALQAVQEAIKPQKQTVLILDENQSLENALRTLLQELVSSAVQSGEQVMQHGRSIDDTENIHGQIPRLLDIVLYLCEKGHVEGGTIFQLLEDLTEMSTMRDCKEVFGYIESKQDILGKPELFGRGKLVMLRTCNQLLRRLSKANDVEFCGRILTFLAHFFPLSERSAVNIKGVFNKSNETKYEKDAPDGISVDFNFYKTFWSLQEHFCDPASTTVGPIKWQKFSSNLMVVLDTFEAQPLSEDDGNANHLEEEEAAAFNIKYLTSSKLMGLELKDPSFRRHILVQCLILFNYLKTPGKNDKDGPSESMKEEIKSCDERVKKLLEMIPPKGKDFLHYIEHILEREKNWIWWKRDSCPAFEKQATEPKTGQEAVRKRKQRWRLGNKELAQLWKWADQNPNAMTDPQRIRTPSVTEYWKPLAEDMDVSAGIEAEYHHKNNRVYCWKGLRFSARQDLEGFSRFTEYGIEAVVPPELLPPDVRSKFHARPNEKAKRARKEEEAKDATPNAEDNQNANAGAEIDGTGSGAELEDSTAPMDADTAAVGISQSGAPTPEESQKQSPEMDLGQEVGQLEADAEAEVEADVGETDLETELDPSGKDAQAGGGETP
ncbi:THO complex subunit 1 [Cinnamomum micranthum f. kanehirae]|uniref:THO complex subunit 1 n=1 Tax=Cinnamomum micranthum f. kanehirae TaxID=337451 RepID=A0A3S3P424_9MAGN|nr:THO complex subunit 1 [Cinnamomum micranthum f. kanehirae]